MEDRELTLSNPMEDGLDIRNMSNDPASTTMFRGLVTAMNVFGSIVALGGLAAMLELRRQGHPILEAVGHGISHWFWSIELWASSVVASRWLLRSGWFNLAALTALLPLLAALGVRILNTL